MVLLVEARLMEDSVCISSLIQKKKIGGLKFCTRDLEAFHENEN